LEVVANKTCARCKREIGDSEMAYTIGENLICPECDAKDSGKPARRPKCEEREKKDQKRKKSHKPLVFVALRILAWFALPVYGSYLFVYWGFGQIPQFDTGRVLIFATIGLWILVFITPLRESLIRLSTGRLPGKKKLQSIGKWLVSLILFFSCVALWHSTSRDRYRQDLFERFVACPVPAGVTILDGAAFKWQDDWSCHLFFETDEKSFRELITDYEPFTLDERTHASLLWDHFNKLHHPACYHKKVKLSDQYYDACYLFWDEIQGLAYFSMQDGEY
jgi:hypothetical protein